MTNQPESKNYERERNEAAESYCSSQTDQTNPYTTVVSFRAGSDWGAAYERRMAEKLVEALDKLANNMGLDAAQIKYETIWCDPKNVSDNLETTIDLHVTWAKQIRDALRAYEGKEGGG